jgi:hypothetical protein
VTVGDREHRDRAHNDLWEFFTSRDTYKHQKQPHQEDTVNIRRTARHHDLGVRLCEETGTVTTSRSRAEAHRDAARTRALGTIGRR